MHDHTESDLGAILDPRYLKLDQTTPQTTVGRFTFPSLTVDTSTLYVDPTNHWVGFGTVTPATPLHVSGLKNTSILRLASTTNDTSWAADTDFIGKIEFYSHDVSNGGAGVVGSITCVSDLAGSGNRTGMLFTTRGTASGVTNNALFINETGNIGINTMTPTYARVEVDGSALGTSTAWAMAVQDGTYNPRAIISHVTATNDHYVQFSSAYSSSTGYADWCFMLGNVGVGTVTPLDKIDIEAGNLRLNKTTYANQFGIISKAGTRFLHDFNYGDNGTVTTVGENVFLGYNSGNLTMGSGATEIYHASKNFGGGTYSLFKITTGFNNFALGYAALYELTSGYRNVAIGNDAGRYYTGSVANQTPNTSIYIGDSTKAYGAGGSNEIVIGYNATGLGSNTVVLGNSSITTTALRGNTGIGITAPTARLHVYSAASSDPNILFRLENAYRDVGFKQGTIGNAQIIQTYSISTATDNGNLLLQPNAGNVGIGTTSPGTVLHISNTTPTIKQTSTRASGGFALNINEVEIVNANGTLQLFKHGVYGSANSPLTMNYYWAGSDSTTAYNDNAFRIYPSKIVNVQGKLGVGASATSPGASLDVYGEASGITSIFRANATTPGNLMEWKNSSGTNMANLSAVGEMGLGTASTTDSRLKVYRQYTDDTSSYRYALVATLYSTPSGNTGAGHGAFGAYFNVVATGANNSYQLIGFRNDTLNSSTGTTAVQYASMNYMGTSIAAGSTATTTTGYASLSAFYPYFNGTFNLGTFYGVAVSGWNSATYTGTINITNAYSMHIASMATSGSATWNITNKYGLYMGDITGGTGSNTAILTNAGNVIFNEGGDASTDFRVESDTYDALFVDASNDSIMVMGNTAGKVGFYGVSAVAQPVLATGASATVDDVITMLQTIGICKQS